ALLRLAQRRRLGDREAVPLERERQALADGRLVVDDEDLRDGRPHGGAPNGPGGGCCGGASAGAALRASATASANLLLRDSITRSRTEFPSACRRPARRACSTRSHLRGPGPAMNSSSFAWSLSCRTWFLE